MPNRDRMKATAAALLWIGAYLALACAPLVLLLVGDVPPGGGFWWDFAMALGFAGMAIMGLQFVLTARFRHAAAPFGIDIIYYFHRLAALVGIALLLAHLAILLAAYPEVLEPLDPREAPAYMSAGRIALLLFVIVIVTSLWRKPLRIDYEAWRIAHAVLATAAFVLAIVHIAGVGHYIQTPWKRWLWMGYTVFWVLVIVHVRVLKPWRMLRAPWRVVEVRPERGRTTTLVLAPDGHAGMRFAPGQFAWLTLRGSPFRFEEHPFSFSGSAEVADRLEFSIKALGDFTRTVADVRPGECAYLDGPYGVFSIDRHRDAPGIVFIAAGVGIAPVMSMLRTMADRRDRRPVTLIYASAAWDEVIFREAIEALGGRLALRTVHVLEQTPPGWNGEAGRLDAAMLERLLPDGYRECEFFICGPRAVSELAQRELRTLGVRPTRVHFELFDMV